MNTNQFEWNETVLYLHDCSNACFLRSSAFFGSKTSFQTLDKTTFTHYHSHIRWNDFRSHDLRKRVALVDLLRSAKNFILCNSACSFKNVAKRIIGLPTIGINIGSRNSFFLFFLFRLARIHATVLCSFLERNNTLI